MTEEKAATKKKPKGGSKKMSDKLEAVGAIGQAISTEVQKVIIGKSHVIDNVLINILSNGNLLFEDYPGLASLERISTMQRKESSRLSQDRFSATYYCLTRLTVHLQRPKRHFWKRCKKSRLPSEL